MLKIIQKCASCLASREVSVPKLGYASISDTEQIQTMYTYLSKDGWLPLGEEMWLDKDCLEKKLELVEGRDY